MYGGPIIKVEHKGEVRYFVWSTIGQGPSMGMTLEQLRMVIERYHGKSGLDTLERERLPRVEATGCSSLVDTCETLMKYGYEDHEGEQREITVEELWGRYVEGDVCSACHNACYQHELDGALCLTCTAKGVKVEADESEDEGDFEELTAEQADSLEMLEEDSADVRILDGKDGSIIVLVVSALLICGEDDFPNTLLLDKHEIRRDGTVHALGTAEYKLDSNSIEPPGRKTKT